MIKYIAGHTGLAGSSILRYLKEGFKLTSQNT